MDKQLSEKRVARQRRAKRVRAKIQALDVHRLTVFRTPRHIYAQVFSPSGAVVVASASTLQAETRQALKSTGNVEAAREVGRLIAERAKAAGVSNVAFDRSGYKYHGRIKALADAARQGGLAF